MGATPLLISLLPSIVPTVHAAPLVAAAGLAPRPEAEVPAAVRVVDAQTIRRRGYRHLGELLADVPELELQPHTDAWSDTVVTVRGLAGNQHLLVLVDGVRAAPTATAWTLAENYPLAEVDRVEITLGPASSVYGPEALVAVVNLVRRPAAGRSALRARAAAGSFEAGSVDAAAETRLGAVDLVAATSLSRTDGAFLPEVWPVEFGWYTDHYQPDGLMLRSPWSQAGADVAPQAWSNRREAWAVDVRAHAGAVSLGVSGRHQSHPTAAGSRPELAVYGEDARIGATHRVVWARHEAGDDAGVWTWTTGGDLADYEVDPDSARLDGTSGWVSGHVYERTTTARADTRLSWRPDPRVRGTLLVDGRLQGGVARVEGLDQPFDPARPAEAQELRAVGATVEAADGSVTGLDVTPWTWLEDGWGAAGELAWTPTAEVGVTMGARADWRSTWGWSLDPRVAVQLSPYAGARMVFAYAEGTQAPAPADRHGLGGAASAVVDGDGEVVGLSSEWWRLPAPDLPPARARAYSVSTTTPVGTFVEARADAFVTRYDDLPGDTVRTAEAWDGVPLTRAVTAVDGGPAWTGGATLGGHAVVPIGPVVLLPTVAWSWVTGERDEAPLAWAAAHTVKGALDVEWRDLVVSGRARWRSESLHPDAASGVDPDAVAPAATLVDLHAAWSPGGGRLGGAVTLDVANLGDTRWYAVGSTAPGSFAAVPQEPRTVRVGLELRL